MSALLAAQLSNLLPIALACGTIVVALAPLVRRGRRLDIFEPIVPACAFLAVLFGARAIAVVHGSSLEYDSQFFSRSDLDGAVLAGFLGTVGFVVGYELRAMRRVQAAAGEPALLDRLAAREFAVVAALAGVALFATHLARGGSIFHTFVLMLHGRSSQLGAVYSSSSEYLSSAPILGTCGALVVLLAVGSRKLLRSEWLIVILSALLPVVVFGLTGSRRFVIPAVAVPIVAAYLIRGRRPRWRWVAIVAVAGFLVLAVVPYARSQGARQSFGGIAGIAKRAATHPQDVMSQFINGNDTEDLSALALEVRALRQPGDFYYGRATFGDVALAPVPSLLVPGKPTTARNDLLVTVFGIPCAPTSGGCPNFSAVGSFYQDFWYPGVAIEMALFGFFAAALWQRGTRRGAGATAIAAAAVTTVFVPIIIRAGWMPGFAWALYFFVPTALGVGLTRLAFRVAGQRSAPVPTA